MKIGSNFRSNKREMASLIGCFHACSLVVSGKGELLIGNNVGMSSTAIVCHHRIEIDDNITIGGGVVIYDYDFHSIDLSYRRVPTLDKKHAKTAPRKISNDVCIGAHSTLLKGVTIGDGSVIDACSVVTRNIPANKVRVGFPEQKIRTLSAINGSASRKEF